MPRQPALRAAPTKKRPGLSWRPTESGRGLFRDWDRAGLLQEAQCVPLFPGLGYFSIHDAVNDDAAVRQPLARRGDPHELAPVRAGVREAGDDLIAVGQLVFDGEANVGAGREQLL